MEGRRRRGKGREVEEKKGREVEERGGEEEEERKEREDREGVGGILKPAHSALQSTPVSDLSLPVTSLNPLHSAHVVSFATTSR